MAREEDLRRDPNWNHLEDRPGMPNKKISPAENKMPPALAQGSGQSEANRFVSNKIVVSNYDLMSLHWMARRYADGRSSYSPGLFNGITRKLIEAGAELKAPLFARDGMGRRYDGLTSEQAAEAEADMPRGFVPEADERLKDAFEALEELLPADWRDGTMDHMPGVAKARMVLSGCRPSKEPSE